MSRSAIAEAVLDLITEGLVVEDILEPGGKGAGRGRPSALLVLAPMAGHVVGIDFGHDHVAVAVADSTGRVLAEQRSTVNVDTQARAALDVASGTASRLIGQLGLMHSDVRCVAAGIPAPLDIRTGAIRSNSIMSGWAGLNPAAELSSLLGWRVVTANDADMGAQGELRFGAARGMRDFIYVKLSEGLGASLVLNGAPYHGAMGLAGEIGHTQFNEQGAWCRCGNRGCLETVVSTTIVKDLLRWAPVQASDPVFPLRAAAENPAVGRFVSEAGRTLGRVLADLCNWLNPAGIILGGELATAGPRLTDGVREAIARYAQSSAAEALDIRTAELGMRSELLGAIAVANHEARFVDDGAEHREAQLA